MNNFYLNLEYNTLLLLKPSKAIRLLLMVLFVSLFANVSSAQKTWNGSSSANWNTAANWTPIGVPTAIDNVIIPNGMNVTVDASAVCNTFTINAGGNNNDVSVGANILSIAGTLTINFPNSNNTNKIVSVTSGTINCGSIVMGNSSKGSMDCRVSVDSGSINVNGDITMNGNANENQLLLGTGGTLNIAGNFIGNGGDIVPGNNSTVNYNGTSAQTIALNGNYQYNNLEVNNVAGAKVQAAVTTTNVTGNIKVKTGTLNNGGFAITGTAGKIFTVANGATFQVAGSTSAFPTGFGTNVLGATSTVVYNGTGAQRVSYIAIPGYGNLTLSTSGTKTVAAALTIQGNVNINNTAVLDAKTFTHNVAGNWTNNGTFTAGTSTINFNSTSFGKTISSGTTNGKFNNLTFDGVGGEWFLNSNLDVANNLTVKNGTVNVNSNFTLAVAGTAASSFVIAAPGTLSFENNSSLVQSGYSLPNNAASIITYYRTTLSIVTNTDYTYWSSPVAGYTLGGVSQNKTISDKYYSFNSSTAPDGDWKQEWASSPMGIGVGYIIRGPEQTGIPFSQYPATFVGVPNNGPYEIKNVIADRSYLLGNPYPSALDAETFLEKNAAVLTGTLYFWTHKTKIGVGVSNAGSGVYAYSGDDYATYNATGGVATKQRDTDPKTGLPYLIGGGSSTSVSQVPSGKIASGQGFFASSKKGIISTSKIIYDNTMRVGVIDLLKEDNSQFFKTKNPKGKTVNTNEKNRIWLNLTNTEGAFKQTLIGYVTDATNDYDSRFDGQSFDGNEFVDFYSVNQDLNLVIQGRALPFDVNDEVPLGYRTTIDGNFTINIDEVDGSMTDQAVFIEDKLTNTVFNLKTGNYTFSTAPGTFNDRFVLKYMDTSKTLTVDTIEKEDGILAFYSSNYNTLIIHNDNFDETVNSVALFNMAGQKIGVWDVSNSEQTNIQVPVKNISSGIYIVKVTTTKGESSKKIIVN
jgi:hypothetical protein